MNLHIFKIFQTLQFDKIAASFFPDRSPYAPVEGVLSPGPTPSDPQTFRPGDASKLNPSGEDHGQIVINYILATLFPTLRHS